VPASAPARLRRADGAQRPTRATRGASLLGGAARTTLRPSEPPLTQPAPSGWSAPTSAPAHLQQADEPVDADLAPQVARAPASSPAAGRSRGGGGTCSRSKGSTASGALSSRHECALPTSWWSRGPLPARGGTCHLWSFPPELRDRALALPPAALARAGEPPAQPRRIAATGGRAVRLPPGAPHLPDMRQFPAG
jgi:hypothetical protein